MKIRLKKTNMRRLASLSALGAGALGATAGTAQANSIVYSGILDEHVGFSRGSLRSATFMGPNGAGALLKRRTSFQSQGGTHWETLRAKAGAYGTGFQFLAAKGKGGTLISHENFALAFPQGAEWGTADGLAALATMHPGGGCAVDGQAQGGAAVKALSHARVALYSTSCFNGPYRFTYFRGGDEYLLFEFTGGKLAQPLYGWAQLDVKIRYNDPEVELVDWAYDTSGAQIPAGDTGTPEPSTFALTGLAALALGAKGMRRWRDARKKAAAA